ncbi:hypothetical protein VPHD479_0409 [Vibrio phage D479]
MADILPLLTTLDEVVEGNAVNVSFTADLDSALGESLVGLSITNFRQNDGITVGTADFSGAYRDSFDLGANGIQYRDLTDDTHKSVSKFSDLPADPTTAHVYMFRAPAVLQTNYTYEVTLDYEITPVPPAPPTPPTQHQLVKTYTQSVRGTWDMWGTQLKDYIARGN